MNFTFKKTRNYMYEVTKTIRRVHIFTESHLQAKLVQYLAVLGP